MTHDLIGLVASELSQALDPLRMAATDPQARRHLLGRVGWRADQLDDAPLAALLGSVAGLVDALSDLAEGLSDGPPDDLMSALATLSDLGDVFDQLRALDANLGSIGAPPDADLIGDLMERLIIDRLQARPPLGAALRATGIIAVEGPTGVPQPGDVTWPLRRPRLRLDRLPDLLTDPVATVANQIAPGGYNSQNLDEITARLHRLLTILFSRTCATVRRGLPRLPELAPPPDFVDVANRTLMLDWATEDTAGGVRLTLTPPDQLGLVATVWGMVDIEERLGDWMLTVGINGSAGGMAINPPDIQFSGTGSRARFDAAIAYAPEDGEPRFQLGGGGVSLSIGAPSLSVFADIVNASPDYGVTLSLGEVQLQIAGGDGFVQKLLPDDGLTVDATFSIGWSHQRGLMVSGSAGLSTRIDIHKRLGPVVLNAVDLIIETVQDGIRVVAAPSFGGDLGPLQVVVEGMGIAVDVALREGNLGPVHIEDVSVTAPTGLGLSLDAGPVSGGGFLRRDPIRGRYEGAMTVRFGDIVISAVGLFETGDPPSLVVILSGEFPPIQLGMGFMLTGIGGALGFHRTIDTDVLRNGVRDGTLGSLMFPEDPVGNAPNILADIARVFPRRDGQHVFGPIARLVWGQPVMVEATLGLVLELPSPVRLAMLGRLRIGMPAIDAALVDLRIDAVGIIDFGAGTASLDAALVDSHVLGLTVEGELALRLGWGSNPNFVFSVGGFHPRFAPPPGVPALARCAISVGAGGNPRIRVEGYMAVTSNSVQFGAKAELYASFGVKVHGLLSFDALFILSPFSFEIDLRASLALSAFGINLMSIGVSLTLSGPAPWRARGTARIKVLFVSVKVGFDVSVGERREERLPARDVWEPLRAAIADPSNWAARLTGNEALGMVHTRDLEPEEASRVAHPLGGLSFRQQVAPFGMDLERFGAAEPAGARRFDVVSIVLEDDTGPDETVASSEVREPFAPGQFLKLEEEDRLSRPSFEPMQAGRAVNGTDEWKLGDTLASPFAFEQSVIDEDTKRGVSMGTGTIPDALIDAVTRFASAAQGAHAGTFTAPVLGFALNDERFELVDRRTAEPIAVSGHTTWPSQVEARQAMAQAVAADPSLDGQLVVSPTFERAA